MVLKMKPTILKIFIFILIIHFVTINTEKNTFLKSAKINYQEKLLTTSNPDRMIQTGSNESLDYLANCYIKIHNMIYDLTPLNLKNDSYSVTTHEGKEIQFSICTDINIKESTEDENCKNILGLVVNKNDCIAFAGSSRIDKEWKVEKEDKNEKLILELPKGDSFSACPEGSRSVTYEIKCEPETYFIIKNKNGFDDKKCHNKIQMESKYACNIGEFKPWYSKFPISKQLVAAILAIVGLFFLFLGMKLFNLTVFLIISIGIGLMIRTITISFFEFPFYTYIIVGAVLGLCIICLIEEFITIIFTIILAINTAGIIELLLSKLFSLSPQALFCIALVISVILSLILLHFVKKFIILITTCIFGSYSVIKAIGIMVNNFPDEIYLYKLVNHEEYNQISRLLTPTIYVYFVAFLILAAVGIIAQSQNPNVKGQMDNNTTNNK